MVKMHATVIAIYGQGVLLAGPSGSGKSDLALRLMDDGAELVSDDYVELTKENGIIIARAPETIKGLMEVRGLGVVKVPSRSAVPVTLACSLKMHDDIERMPEELTVLTVKDVQIPQIDIDPRAASAATRIRFALSHLGDIVNDSGLSGDGR